MSQDQSQGEFPWVDRSRPRLVTAADRLMVCGVISAVIAVSTYITVRLAAMMTDFSLLDGLVGGLLMAAELFISVHCIGYLVSMIKAGRRPPPGCAPGLVSRYTAAPVAVLMTSFNEAEDVLEETLASIRAMDYPSMKIYMLDDSTLEGHLEITGRLAARYGARLVHRTNRAGYKGGAINDFLPELTEPYIAVLDADQRPCQSWLKEIVPMLEENPSLAFVQTPQFYINTEHLPVSRAACNQQVVFYEYICEGKGSSNAMFCCGSNVVLRRQSLLSVEVLVDGRRHFFDETSVTEDFATSIKLHMRGWQSAYVNRNYVVGMGPETLHAYFTQQLRWAMGTLGVFLHLVGQFVTHPRALTAAQWWEYLLSSSYYFTGSVNCIYMLAAASFLMFGLRPVHLDSTTYIMLFVPYFSFTMAVFLIGMRLRGLRVRRMMMGTVLSFGTSWIFVKAALIAVFGLKREFGVTPKGVGGSVPWRNLMTQLLMFGLCLALVAIAVFHVIAIGPEIPYVATGIWAAYHATMLGTLLFYFNRPVTVDKHRLLFEPAETA